MLRKQPEIIFHQKVDTMKRKILSKMNWWSKRKNTPRNMPVSQLLIPNKPILSEIEEPDYEISDQEDIPNWTVKSNQKGRNQNQDLKFKL